MTVTVGAALQELVEASQQRVSELRRAGDSGALAAGAGDGAEYPDIDLKFPRHQKAFRHKDGKPY